jgi:serine/threonine-protein kinase
MIQLELDHNGLLTLFEAIPAQRQDTPVRSAPVDWGPLFALAGLDMAALQPADPVWTWLAASDTRAAWTGVWPGSKRPLRVEAAALGGRPVAFMLAGPWQTPWRTPEPANAGTTVFLLLLMCMAVAVLVIGVVLARNNLRQNRGDRRAAARLAVSITALLLGLWGSSVHLVLASGLLATFLLAVCTSVFYGALLWTVYIALEPFVRRHWPQVLVSSTNVLSGHVADPVVGRGVLLGLRQAAGVVFEEAVYAVRNVLFYFFVLFVLRVLLRNQWAAAIAFTVFWTIFVALGSQPAWEGAVVGFLLFGSTAFVVLRWGLLSLAVGLFVVELLLDPPVTLDASAWYFGNMLLLLAIVVGLTVWSFYTSLGGRVWSAQPLGHEVRRHPVSPM